MAVMVGTVNMEMVGKAERQDSLSHGLPVLLLRELVVTVVMVGRVAQEALLLSVL